MLGFPSDNEVLTLCLTDRRQARYDQEMSHPLYDRTANCDDAPELLPSSDGAPVFLLPETDPETVVAAVRARRSAGGVCQEKIDGCWVALELDETGRVALATSRATLPLRFARSEKPWLGQLLHRALAGWTIVGEMEAGTQRAARVRDGERELEPVVYAFACFDAEGTDRTAELGAVLGRAAHPRLRHIPQALRGEDWGSFTSEVLERGGEGVVIRQGGELIRCKPVHELDRVVLRTFWEADQYGKKRSKAQLGVCVSAGKRPRYKPTQIVIVPGHILPAELRARRVVKVIGASVTPEGVIRHGRISEVRPQEEKQPTECRL